MKRQVQSSKPGGSSKFDWCARFGIWSLVFLWSLGFGIWNFAAAAEAESAKPAITGVASPRIFICGHSFHVFVSRFLPELAQAAGIEFRTAGMQSIGGSRTIQHWDLPDPQNKVKAALRAGEVDVLTVAPHLLIPDEGIDNFTKLGLEKNPRLRVLVQASWLPRDATPIGAKFTNEMRNAVTSADLKRIHDQQNVWLKSIEDQVRKLNQSVGHEAVYIVPAGDAVMALRQRIIDGKVPGLTKQADLFRDELGHPQSPMVMLVTYCQFAAIYRRSPVGLPVPALLKDAPQAAELNRVLQEIAWNTVSNYSLSGVKAKPAK
jgi:hypothetical protein